MTDSHKNLPSRPGQLSVRKQRIERWAYKGRSTSMNIKALRSSSTLGTSSTQKRSDSSLFQDDHRLNSYLYQLGEEREKLLERYKFDQKLFANKQAVRHKDNQDIIRTLDYVRKCCKYSDMHNNEETFIDPSVFFEDKHSRSRSLNSMRPPTSTNMEKSLNDDNENSKQHVQFHMNSNRASQSAHISRKSQSSSDRQKSISAHGFRSISSAPVITSTLTIGHRKKLLKTPNQPSRRIFATKKNLKDFSHYPEKYISKSNFYFPLLHRHAMELQSNDKQRRQSVDIAYDDAKSFLSEEIDGRKLVVKPHIPIWDNHTRQSPNKLRGPSKLNLMDSNLDESSLEYQATLSRFRDREYAHLQKLINSNPIENIIQPMSLMKSSQTNRKKSRNLNEILHSIDSLNIPDKNKKNQQNKMNIERNLSKLGILIF